MKRNEAVLIINERIKEAGDALSKQIKTNDIKLTPEQKLLIAIFGDSEMPKEKRTTSYMKYKKALVFQLLVRNLLTLEEEILRGIHDDDLRNINDATELYKTFNEFAYPTVLLETQNDLSEEYKMICQTLKVVTQNEDFRIARVQKAKELKAPDLIIENERRLLSEVSHEREVLQSLKKYFEGNFKLKEETKKYYIKSKVE